MNTTKTATGTHGTDKNNQDHLFWKNAIQGIEKSDTILQQVPQRDVRGYKIQHVAVHNSVHKGHEQIFLTLTSSANSTPSFPARGKSVSFLI